MPGKRPRQIQRTTSMSQLGGIGMAVGARFSRTAPDSFLGDAGSHKGFSAPLKQELLETMEVCPAAEEAEAMEENGSSMAIDGSVEESLHASHAEALCLSDQNLMHLGAPHQSAQTGNLVQSLNEKPISNQGNFCKGHEASRSVQTTHFLDACFLCSKRLGCGRDVFIYRGDRAFCSVECRHSQIVADEMREKCGMAVKEGGGANTSAGNSASTNQVETAAAA